MNQWNVIVASLLGVVVGGGLSWLNSRYQILRQEDRERKRHILTKLEELHEVLSSYRQEFNSLTADRFGVAQGASSRYVNESNPIPKERLRMLVGFYADGLDRFLQNVEQVGNEHLELAWRCGNLHRQDEATRSQLVKALCEKQLQLDSVCEMMQKQIVLLSKNYL